MFGELVESSALRKKTNKSWTVGLSAMLQVAVVGVFVLIPLIYTEALPKQFFGTFLVIPPPPRSSPPPAEAGLRVARPVVHLIQSGKLMAPPKIPMTVQIIKEEEAPDVGTSCPNCVPGGVPGGDPNEILPGAGGGTGT